MASNKIINGLFVWGRSAISTTDLAVYPKDQINTGFQGGESIYADNLNSVLRDGSIFGYTFINLLKEGPNTTYTNADISSLSGNWDDGLTSYSFNYDVNDLDKDIFRDRLKEAFDAYIRRSQSARAINANSWTTKRKFQIVDNDVSNLGTALEINGDTSTLTGSPAAYQLKLPATIKASLQGNADTSTEVTTTIAGRTISNIFETSSTVVKEATYASYVGTYSNPANIGSARTMVYINNGNYIPSNFKNITDYVSRWYSSVYISDAISSLLTGKDVRTEITYSLDTDFAIKNICIVGDYNTAGIGNASAMIGFSIYKVGTGEPTISYGTARAFKIDLTGITQSIIDEHKFIPYQIVRINTSYKSTSNYNASYQRFWGIVDGTCIYLVFPTGTSGDTTRSLSNVLTIDVVVMCKTEAR